MNCNKPDRDEPKMKCGYPLPCPYHTIVIDTTTQPTTVITPVSANVDPITAARLKQIASVLTPKSMADYQRMSKRTTGPGSEAKTLIDAYEIARLVRYSWAENGFAPLAAELGISPSQVRSLVKAKVIELRSNFEGGPAIYVYLTPKGMRMAQTRRRV